MEFLRDLFHYLQERRKFWLLPLLLALLLAGLLIVAGESTAGAMIYSLF